MILDAAGVPTSTDGKPTGRKFSIVEITKGNQNSWQVINEGAVGIPLMEMTHVLSICLQSLIQNLRVAMEQQKVKQALQSLNKE